MMAAMPVRMMRRKRTRKEMDTRKSGVAIP